MCFWINKVAIVTDCESELGLCIVQTLFESKMIVIGFCKSVISLNDVKRKLKEMNGNKNAEQVILYECDITNPNQLKNIFEETKAKYEGPSVLINNAFCKSYCSISDGVLKDVKSILDININAVVTCTRLVAGHLIEKKCRGHIIFISDFTNTKSIHLNMVTASRATVHSINDILKEEFRYLKANIKVTNIVYGNDEENEESTSKKPEDIAEIVKFVLNTPDHLQVHKISMDSNC